jgi:methionyl-tRNA synthetase
MSGATPVVRSTEHFYFRLSEFSDQLEEWLRSRRGWRKHVLNFSLGWIEEGLQDRPITRDIEWGVEIPVEELGPGKRIYVWFDAVIGYLSAAKEWAQIQGDPEAWRKWWENPEAEHFYFIGKDNVPFHTIIWPAMLMGYGGLELPTDVPANQYVTFHGGKASSSRGVGLTIGQALERFEPDALRYALAKNFPETNDTDLPVEEIARSINEELVATWGNLVNRVVSMTHRYFDGVVPAPGELAGSDQAILSQVDAALDEVADLISAVKLRAGLAAAMGAAQAVNGYLSNEQPWQTAKTDLIRTGTTLNVALNAIAGIAIALSPYLPATSATVLASIGVPVTGRAPEWARPKVSVGAELGPAVPLFSKVDPAAEVD